VDFEVDPSMVDESMAHWRDECDATDRALARAGSLDSIGAGNKRSVRWNLHKLIGEYARHNGHADIVRERIDGSTGGRALVRPAILGLRNAWDSWLY
jgi:hypothetical protein